MNPPTISKDSPGTTRGIEAITQVLAGDFKHGDSRIFGYMCLISETDAKEMNK
jgi:hypothetical protein